MDRLKIYYLLIGVLITLILVVVARSGASPTLLYTLIGLIIIAVLVFILSVPYFYQKKMDERQSKSLYKFLLVDPKTRDMIRPDQDSPPNEAMDDGPAEESDQA
jgi:hypothetical protein